MFSRRFVPGHRLPARIRHEIWDDNNLGNAIPGATPRAEIDVRGPVPLPGLPIVARHGRPLTLRARVRNASTRPFPAQATYGRRLVRLGAQLCAADGSLVEPRLRARVAARRRSSRARAPRCRSRSPPRPEPGRYALKFDLVSEGIDWFEACGSPTTTKTLVVI